MLCKDCSKVIVLDGIPLCIRCLGKWLTELIEKIRKKQKEEGFHSCFRTDVAFCDHGCKYEKLCLLKDYEKLRSFGDEKLTDEQKEWGIKYIGEQILVLIDALRSIQYKEGCAACCGKNGATCSLELSCLFGKICVPKNVGFRWLSRISRKDIENGRFRQIGLAD
jgi:hypothetical protein